MLIYEGNTARSEESGASYTVETDTEFGLTSLRVWVEAPEGSGLPNLELGGQSVYSTADDARTAAEHIDAVATKAREAMQAAHALAQILEQVQARQQQAPTGMNFGPARPAFGNDRPAPGPTGNFGFK